jgi:hypothetical protein
LKNILRSSNFGLTKWCVALIAAGWVGAASSQGAKLFTEDFTFSGFLTANGWAATSGAGTSALTTQAITGLTYAGHTGSDVGNAVAFVNAGEDVLKSFTAQTSGTVYASALINISAAQSGDYFFSIANGTTTFIARLYAKSSGSGYVLGIGKSTSPVVYDTTVRSFNATYLVVLKYAFLPSASDDTISLFVGPTLGGTTEAPALLTTGSTITDTASLGFAQVRQGTNTQAPTGRIDAIRVGTTWADVTELGVVSPSITSSAATLVGATTATLNGNVTADGGAIITERGFVYKTSTGVTINDNKTAVSGTTGAFSLNLSSLTTGATYYFRAYASNSVGMTLSTEQSFTTGAVAPPALTSAVVATVDTAFEVTFPEDATWRGAINGVTVDGVALTGGYAVSSGKITFTPSASVPAGALQTPGTKAVVVTASGYNNAEASQILGAGLASQLVIVTQPAAPAVNPGTFATQAVVALQDQYGNATASTTEVTAAVGAGTWTLGGTVTVAAVNGTATFSDLTATSAAAVTGATISFSSGSLGAVSSAAFNLAAANELQLAAVGTAVTQNFDSLASTGDSSLMPLGWFFVETGSLGNTTYAPGTGSSNFGNTYSFGADGSTERALGGLQSGSLVPVFGAKIRNTTGSTLTDLSISYVGERWRLGATGREDRLDFEYSTDATSLSDGTWTPVPSLNFTAPISTGTLGALNGNDTANRVAVNGTVQNLSLANGAVLWIRWVDSNPSGADDGLGIDDFSVTGVNDASEPANSAPTDIALSASSIAENNAVGDSVGTLSSNDVDAGDTFTYTLVSGTGDTDNASFNITGSSLQAGVVFDFETPPTSYSIRVQTKDSANNTFEKVFTITVTDVLEGSTYNSWLGALTPSDAAFLDYVFGAATPGTLDPSLRPTVAVTAGNLVLTYYVRQGTLGLTVTPKTSADLAAGPSGWTTVSDDEAVGSPTTRGDGVTVQMRKASVPMIGDRKFLRVEAVQQ